MEMGGGAQMVSEAVGEGEGDNIALTQICSEAHVPAAPVIAFFIGFLEGSLEARDFVFNVP